MPKVSSTNRRNERWLHQTCPFSVTLSALGNRWRAPILWKLLHGDRTFGDLSRALPLITEKMLTQELKQLQELGLVERNVRSQSPPRIEYVPTQRGLSLEPILAALYAWGESQQSLNP